MDEVIYNIDNKQVIIPDTLPLHELCHVIANIDENFSWEILINNKNENNE